MFDNDADFQDLPRVAEYIFTTYGWKKPNWPQGESWPEIADKCGVSPENPDPNKRGHNAMSLWRKFLTTDRAKRCVEKLQKSELVLKRVTVDKDGEEKFKTFGQPPANDIPDPSKLVGAKLVGYTENPHGGSWKRWKIEGDTVAEDDIRAVLQETAVQPITVKSWKPKAAKGSRTQVLKLGDVHVGMASEDNVFGLRWNAELLMERADVMLERVDKSASEIVFIFGGDVTDGLDGKTTRGGHDLPQNMTSKQQLTNAKDFALKLIDGTVQLTDAKVRVIWLSNSNHGGILDFAAGEILKTCAGDRWNGQVEFVLQEGFIDSHEVAGFDLVTTHGKDDKHMKNGFSRNLSKDHIKFIERFIEYKGLKNPVLVRFDQHQYCDSLFDRFRDLLCPAFSNPSSWVALNFSADYKGGFVDGTIEDGEISFKLISFKQ